MSNYCQLCGKPIQGRAKALRHALWPREVTLRVCEECLATRPRCQVCHLPMAGLTAEEVNNGICPTCATYIRLCRACGQPIKGEYVEIEGAGSYCKTCFRHRPACDGCGAPLTNDRWQLSDGRVTCAHCHTTAIYSATDAAALYEEMKTVAAQLLGLTLNIPTGLALVDRNQLAEVIRQQSNGTQPLDPVRTLGIYARKGMRRSIYVQSGLPRMLLLYTAAHEYAHAWQGENCPFLRDPLALEGFAEWVAYKVLGAYHAGGQQKRMLARNDIYGQGLRLVLEMEAQNGEFSVLESCRAAK